MYQSIRHGYMYIPNFFSAQLKLQTSNKDRDQR